MISDIVNIVEGRMEAKGCVSKSGSCTGVSGRCLTHDLWDELSRHIELFLGQISLVTLTPEAILPLFSHNLDGTRVIVKKLLVDTFLGVLWMFWLLWKGKVRF